MGCAFTSSEEQACNGVGGGFGSGTDYSNRTVANLAVSENSNKMRGNHQARTRKRWSETSMNLCLVSKVSLATDNVHEHVEEDFISPAQLYSTESGRMFHAGQILIVLVGLPASSKTMLSVAITRYMRWFGVRTRSFHASEYRREMMKPGISHVPPDYFLAIPKTKESKRLRRLIMAAVIKEMQTIFRQGRCQLAIYDAMNIIRSERQKLAQKFVEMNIKVFFIESIVNNPELLMQNIQLAACSADYKGWSREDAMKNYLQRLIANRPLYQELSSSEELSYLKYHNFGEKLIVNDNSHGYLINKIVYFLMNLKDKKGRVYLARCGTSDNDRYIDDEILNREGIKYSQVLTDLVINRITNKRMELNGTDKLKNFELLTFKNDNSDIIVSTSSKVAEGNISSNYLKHDKSDKKEDNSFVVWTAPRKRTYDTAMFFADKGIKVTQRVELQQLHQGIVADLTECEIKNKFPAEYNEYLKAPYHYRYPRAESYHDLAVRIEPLLLELERMRGDILIIGHESTLRALYGYFAACSSQKIPFLNFTRNQLVEISFHPFKNIITKIPIDLTKE